MRACRESRFYISRWWSKEVGTKVSAARSLQLVGLPHHQVEVAVVIDRHADPAVVVHELFQSYLKLENNFVFLADFIIKYEAAAEGYGAMITIRRYGRPCSVDYI